MQNCAQKRANGAFPFISMGTQMCQKCLNLPESSNKKSSRNCLSFRHLASEDLEWWCEPTPLKIIDFFLLQRFWASSYKTFRQCQDKVIQRPQQICQTETPPFRVGSYAAVTPPVSPVTDVTGTGCPQSLIKPLRPACPLLVLVLLVWMGPQSALR